MALALIVSEKMTYTQKLNKNLQSQWTVERRSRISSAGSFELHSSWCMHDPSFMALALIVSEKMTYMQKLDKNLHSQWTIKRRSRISSDGSFELHSFWCMHDLSFMALALIVSEKMTYTQKLNKNLQSQWTAKRRSRISSDGSFELHSSRCMHDPSFMALALIVSEKMTYMQKLNKSLRPRRRHWKSNTYVLPLLRRRDKD